MMLIGFFISIVLGILRLTDLWDGSWWFVIAPTFVGLILNILFSYGIAGFFELLMALSDRSIDKGIIKRMEKETNEDPRYKDL